jgi:hypothetical protein
MGCNLLQAMSHVTVIIILFLVQVTILYTCARYSMGSQAYYALVTVHRLRYLHMRNRAT